MVAVISQDSGELPSRAIVASYANDVDYFPYPVYSELDCKANELFWSSGP